LVAASQLKRSLLNMAPIAEKLKLFMQYGAQPAPSTPPNPLPERDSACMHTPCRRGRGDRDGLRQT
jgi:hypothetical protein